MVGGTRVALAVAVVASLHVGEALACSGTIPVDVPRVIPADGSTGVSTASSIYVLTSSDADSFTLSAGGRAIALGRAESLGNDLRGRTVWRLTPTSEPNGSMLQPSTEYIVSQVGKPSDGGTAGFASRFTTGAGYDKEPGTAPVVKSLRFFRVRYPIEEIGAGRCVFDEYVGYLAFELDPATIPNTPPEGVLYEAQVRPKNGSFVQSIRFTGDDPFVGRDPTQDPYPRLGEDWTLELDAAREYCLSLDARGDGERARPPLVSELVCAPVEEIVMPGAGAAHGAASAAESNAGCNMAARGDGGHAGELAALAALLAARRRGGGRTTSRPSSCRLSSLRSSGTCRRSPLPSRPPTSSR